MANNKVFILIKVILVIILFTYIFINPDGGTGYYIPALIAYVVISFVLDYIKSKFSK
ncbi:hypothetical protein St703_14470 [Sporolactobacillus terrae]|uniref:Uncharacterized protein n=1 Tax=Sporolactobacillus terrae TaxID=269673 RepID=A0A5K7WWT1_9BACL|nr:hypothetical protein St703_14470 [Sporolactobacillus terrae]